MSPKITAATGHFIVRRAANGMIGAERYAARRTARRFSSPRPALTSPASSFPRTSYDPSRFHADHRRGRADVMTIIPRAGEFGEGADAYARANPGKLNYSSRRGACSTCRRLFKLGAA